jgi:hypothetical protein
MTRPTYVAVLIRGRDFAHAQRIRCQILQKSGLAFDIDVSFEAVHFKTVDETAFAGKNHLGMCVRCTGLWLKTM